MILMSMSGKGYSPQISANLPQITHIISGCRWFITTTGRFQRNMYVYITIWLYWAAYPRVVGCQFSI